MTISNHKRDLSSNRVILIKGKSGSSFLPSIRPDQINFDIYILHSFKKKRKETIERILTGSAYGQCNY